MNTAQTFSTPDALFDFLDGAGEPVAPAITAARPVLPRYALDGRPLLWNADGSACMFDSAHEEYHSDSNAVSASVLRQMARSAAHYRAHASKPRKQTASQRFGTAVHAAILEPARFKTDYVVWSGKRRGKAWAAFEAANKGKEILTQEEYDDVVGCARKALATVVVRGEGGREFLLRDLVELGIKERNIYWVDKDTGLTCKARLDLMSQHVTFDVKTTDDSRPGPFLRQAYSDGYDIQAAFYTRARVAFEPALTGACPFIFIACEAKAPHEPWVHPADANEFTAFGDKRVGSLLREFKECRATGVWSGYKLQGKLAVAP